MFANEMNEAWNGTGEILKCVDMVDIGRRLMLQPDGGFDTILTGYHGRVNALRA